MRAAHLTAPDNPDIANHYAVALHKQGEDAVAADILGRLLGSGRSFAAQTEAADLFERIFR